MTEPRLKAAIADRVEKALGYVNFSSGTHDPAFLCHLNELFRHINENDEGCQPPHEMVHQLMQKQLACASQRNSTFKDADQAQQAIELVFNHVLPSYMEHHRDLLFHRGPESIFNAFFIGRAFEVVLQLSGARGVCS